VSSFRFVTKEPNSQVFKPLLIAMIKEARSDTMKPWEQ
jgi:hypothetical protein